MTFIALFRDPSVSLATDQCVLAANEVQPVKEAVDMANRVTQHLQETEEQLRIARQQGYDDGFSAGKVAGLLAGREEIASKLTSMIATAHQQRLALQGSVARLAMQVLRKIAGEIGAAEVVAGLAQTAANDLVPGASLQIWVHPSVEASVRTRLNTIYSLDSEKPLRIEIRINETLDTFDCILSTDSGDTVAGLDEQLKRLEILLNQKLESEVKR